jgi:hypothetical protein
MGEPFRHDLDGYSLTDQIGGMAVAEHVKVEIDAGAGPQPGH